MIAVLLLLLAVEWPAILAPAVKAVVRLEMQAPEWQGKAICSGTVINAKAGYALTAAHCVDAKDVALTVNGRHAEVVRQNRVLDLAVIRFSPQGETALVLAAEAPAMGAEIAVMGFAFGSRQLGSQVGHVVTPLEEDEQRTRVAVDVIAGDSGGPCLNAKGELVGISSAVVFRGPMHLGLIVPLKVVREFAEPYLPKKETP